MVASVLGAPQHSPPPSPERPAGKGMQNGTISALLLALAFRVDQKGRTELRWPFRRNEGGGRDGTIFGDFFRQQHGAKLEICERQPPPPEKQRTYKSPYKDPLEEGVLGKGALSPLPLFWKAQPLKQGTGIQTPKIALE